MGGVGSIVRKRLHNNVNNQDRYTWIINFCFETISVTCGATVYELVHYDTVHMITSKLNKTDEENTYFEIHFYYQYFISFRSMIPLHLSHFQ